METICLHACGGPVRRSCLRHSWHFTLASNVSSPWLGSLEKRIGVERARSAQTAVLWEPALVEAAGHHMSMSRVGGSLNRYVLVLQASMPELH